MTSYREIHVDGLSLSAVQLIKIVNCSNQCGKTVANDTAEVFLMQ